MRLSIPILRHVLLGGILCATPLAFSGCGEVVNYSIESRRQGIELYNAGQYANAAGSFRNALRQNPGDYKSYYYLARAEEAQGAMQKALQAYKSALDTMSLTLEGREDKAFRERILDGLAGAIAKADSRDAEIDKLLTQAKANPTAQIFVLLARIYRNSQDADSALDAYNRGALQEPRNFDVLKEYGLYLEQLGQNQRAEVVLRQAYTLNPNDNDVNGALRRLGVIPGPSIKEQNQLAEPLIPRGPIPRVRMPGEDRNAPTPGASQNGSVPNPEQHQAPRD